jgi:hypothetical protein
MSMISEQKRQLARRQARRTINEEFTLTRIYMATDSINSSDDVFDDWLRDISRRATGDDLNEERFVQLVSATLRENQPATRARCFVDLANMCYAMADKALGSQTPAAKCLEVVVSVGQRH